MGATASSGPRSARRSPCPVPGRACAAGNPKSYAMRFDRTSTATISRAPRDARMVMKTSPPTDHSRGPHRRSTSPPLGTSMPEFVGRRYTSSGRSLGLNGGLFVHSGRPRSSIGWAERRVRLLHRPSHRRRRDASRWPAAFTIRPSPGARSSVGERSLHTREVAGSKPAAPTRKTRLRSDPLRGPVPIGAKTPPSAKAFSRVRSSSENRIACA